MATSQGFLDGLRAQAGFGMNYTRPSRTRSADQNNTISGNPGYSTNMPMPPVNFNQQPMSWQQQVMARQQQQQQLAQDPTNINYIQPMANQFQNYGGPQQTLQPSAFQNARGAMAAMGTNNGNTMGALGVNMGVNPNAGPQQSMFVQPRPMMRGGIPRNLAAGPSGFRFVRPMAR